MYFLLRYDYKYSTRAQFGEIYSENTGELVFTRKFQKVFTKSDVTFDLEGVVRAVNNWLELSLWSVGKGAPQNFKKMIF